MWAKQYFVMGIACQQKRKRSLEVPSPITARIERAPPYPFRAPRLSAHRLWFGCRCTIRLQTGVAVS
eukprot:scaffold109_cov389-Prasinococcus_capsulatus_cf.AAC.3